MLFGKCERTEMYLTGGRRKDSFSRGKMEKKHQVTRSFFKIMLPGYREKLVLPPALCMKLKEEKSAQAILTSQRGTMKVSVCKNHEGIICFKDGWKDFARRNDLSIGDAIVFEPTYGLRFKAIVFDKTACEKQFPEEVNLDEHPEDAEEEADMGLGTSYNSVNPRFTITMKRHNGLKRWATVNIPAAFLRSNDLSKKTSAKLKDPLGRQWPVRLSFKKRSPNRARCLMNTGWYKFYEANKLKDGDVCIFELLPYSQRSNTVVMDVQIKRAAP